MSAARRSPSPRRSRTQRLRVLAAMLALGALAGASPASLAAQTNDVYFRAWDWTADPTSARALALAGASVALVDDASGLDGNPATLASLERNELTGSLASRRAGRTRAGDHLAARTNLALVGGAVRLGERWCLGGFYAEPQATRLALSAGPESASGHDAGTLDAMTTDVGGTLALRLTRRLYVGARIGATHLALSGEYQRVTGDGEPAWLAVGTAGGATAVTTTAGLLVELTSSLHLGAAFTPEASWSFTRTAVSPRLGLNLDVGSTFAVRRPSRLAAGLAWRLSPRLLALAQFDDLRAGPLPPGLPGGYRELPHLRKAWHTRAGLELSLPFHSHALQARVGLEFSRPHAEAQAVDSPGPEGASESGTGVLVQPFRELDLATGLWQREPLSSFGLTASDSDAASLGLALVTRLGLRLDAAARFARQRTILAFGLTLRM